MRDVIILGAGHNGLIAAWHLAQAGLKPLVLERRDVVGGGAITEEIHPGFRCSALEQGPLDTCQAGVPREDRRFEVVGSSAPLRAPA